MDNFNHIQSQPWYNNLNFSEADWRIENDKALALQKIIENVFEGNPNLEISGWQLRDYLAAKMGKKVNINSVRRTLSNLKNDFRLFKTEKMVIGNEGRPEFLYARKSTKNTPTNEYLNK